MSLLRPFTASLGVMAGLASILAKWPVSKFIDLELGQGLPPKAVHKMGYQGSPSQPTRKDLGSRTNRSQRARGRAKTRM